jgi:alkylhydroperoxidase family enzyme
VTARIPPLPEPERSDDQRSLLGFGTAGPAGDAENIFTTLVRHPGLFRRWLPFGGKLLAGKLPARDRELLILRTAWNCRADYEWGQHVRLGLAAGLTDEEIARVPAGAGPDWPADDQLLLQAADELHATAGITDATWAELAARYDTQQLIELPMLVGHYHLVAFTLNTLRVEREPGVEGLPPG